MRTKEEIIRAHTDSIICWLRVKMDEKDDPNIQRIADKSIKYHQDKIENINRMN